MSRQHEQARFRAQLLTGRQTSDPVAVVEQLLAVQAQDPRGCRLALRARAPGLTVDDIHRAMTVDRSLVVTWLNRGTLHMVRAADYWWLHALTTPQLATSAGRRLGNNGVSAAEADRAVEAVEQAVTETGPQTRAQLRERVSALGIRTGGQALIHVLFLASVRGRVIRGPMLGSEQAFVRPHDWLGPPPAIDPDGALAQLARRYLAGHGPATDRDLARWAGVGLGTARRALLAIDDLVRDVGDGRVDLIDRESADGLPPPILLGAFDPLLLGWESREFVTGPHTQLVTVNGLFRPFALVDGRAVATWTIARGAVAIQPLERIPVARRADLDADAAEVIRFLKLG